MLRPQSTAEIATKITTAAAVAACCAIEECTDEKPLIKWVNDVFVRQKKVCGILTEASAGFGSGQLSHMVIGIGINTRMPNAGFPGELRETAGSVFGSRVIPDLRNRLLAGTLDRLLHWYRCPEDRDWLRRYRERSAVLGKNILILAPGREPEPARALALDDACGLVVLTEAGEQKTLTAGEVSIRPGTPSGRG